MLLTLRLQWVSVLWKGCFHQMCRSTSLVSAVVLAGLVAACSDSPIPSAPDAPDAVRATGLVIQGPSEVAPGTTAMFTAAEYLSNGTLRDVSAGARFITSNPSVLSFDAGLATAHTRGEVTVAVQTDAFPGSAPRTIIVVPPGTYRLQGSVYAASEEFVPGIRVEVLGSDLATVTDHRSSFVLYGVPPEADLRFTLHYANCPRSSTIT